MPHLLARNAVFVILCLYTISLHAQQCTLPFRTYIPTADEVRYEQFGSAIDVDQNYMVVGATGNHSLQVYAGLAFVYKLDANNHWVKIADLKPSDPMKFGAFGGYVAILGNTIVVHGREFNDQGVTRDKLYVFEKNAAAEWTTTTEAYFITKNFGPILSERSFGQIRLRGDELVATAGVDGKPYLEIYKRSSGQFAVAQSIEIYKGYNAVSSYEWNLKTGDDFIALASGQFEHIDRSRGVVLIYVQNGSSYNTDPAVLTATSQTMADWHGLGLAIATYGTTVFAQGARRNPDDSYDQTYYVFEKPVGGWVSTSQDYLFDAPGYTSYQPQLVANADYLLSTGGDFHFIAGFRKTSGTWSSSASRFFMNNVDITKSEVGHQLALTDQHFIAGCMQEYSFTSIGEEMIADYYSPTNAWDTPALPFQKIIQQKSANASTDLFSTAFDAWHGQLAVTARDDDEFANEGGAVYIFDTFISSTTPIQKVFNPEIGNSTEFGTSVAMGDSIMFVGAPAKDSVINTTRLNDMGKVYVYRLTGNGWKYSSQIIPPKVDSKLSFGKRLAWSPGYCAVTEFYTGDSERMGHVHIYKEEPSTGKFKYIATLNPSQPNRFDFFGKSIEMTDSIIAIGVGIGASSGYKPQVYMYKKKGEWRTSTEDARLYPSDAGFSDHFGTSVSMDGDYVVVGATYAPGFPLSTIPRNYIVPGAAYVFKKPAQGWKGSITEVAKLSPSDPIEFGMFGYAVAIDHDDIYVGAPSIFEQYAYANNLSNSNNQLLSGKVYHYTMPPGGWTSASQEDKQQYSNSPDPLDGYGGAIRIVDRTLFVGAINDDTDAGFQTGSVQMETLMPKVKPYTVLCTDAVPTQLFGAPGNGVWAGPGINSSTGKFSTVIAGPGVHNVTYTVNGCLATAQIEVLPDQLVVSHQSDAVQTKCVGNEISLALTSNESANNYDWYFRELPGGERVMVDSMKQSISVEQPGYYDVIVHRGICPTKSASFKVADEPAVSISLDPIPSVCTGSQTIQLSATPSSGMWSGPAISSIGILDPANLQNGNYKEVYEIITPVGCHWKDSINVNVDLLKPPTLQYNGEPICGKPVNLALTNIDGNTTVKWYHDDGTDVSGQTSSVLSVGVPGTYFAAVSKNSCHFQSDPATVGIVTGSLFVPNVFTANGDAINDHFEVQSTGINGFHMILFNRDGQTLFETEDQSFQWRGDNVPTGVYFWRVTYLTCESLRKEEKGWVHLRR